MEKNNNNKITKGYKALNKDMTTRYGNMTYELNKEYNFYLMQRILELFYFFS